MTDYSLETWNGDLTVHSDLWPRGMEPECFVVERRSEGAEDFVLEADSYGSAHAYIADMHDRQEDLGLPLASYRIIPRRSTPGGRDVR